MGSGALDDANSNDNTAVGHDSLPSTTTGTKNVAVGRLAGQSNTTAEKNVFLGEQAGKSVTTGIKGVYIGQNAGKDHATGDQSIYVGHNATCSSSSVAVEYVFGTGITGKGQQQCFLGGNLGTFNEANESHFDTTSDERIKKNIVNYDTGLSIINQLQVRNFEYKTEDEIITDNPELKDVIKSAVVNKTGTQTGLIAQEAEKVLASTVITSSTGVKTLHSDDIFWHMLNAIKELSAKVTALEAG